MENLPKGWKRCKLGDVVEYGKTTKADMSSIKDTEWVLELEDIEKNTSKLLKKMTFADRKSKSAKNIFSAGDVLYGKLRPYLNKVIIARDDGVCSSEIIPLQTDSKYVDKDFLFYWLKSQEFLSYVDAVSYGVNMPRLGTKDGINAPFLLAPLEVQTQIAEKLNDLLGQVTTIQSRLDKLPETIKEFRQSVLAAAVSGKLTEKWRGDSQYDEDGFPAPWGKTSFKEIGELARGKSKHRPRNDTRLFGGKYPFIQTGEVAQSGGEITSHSKTYSEFGLEQSRLFPKDTLCITIAANIADTAVLTFPACFPDSVVGFIAKSGVCETLFIKYFIDVNKENLEQFAPATAQKNINLKVLQGLSIPYPTLEEQSEIVQQVTEYFAFATTLESNLKNTKAQVDNLTQSILAKAFRGELVDQKENGESAEELLAKITAAREAAEKLEKATKKATRTRKPKKAKAE